MTTADKKPKKNYNLDAIWKNLKDTKDPDALKAKLKKIEETDSEILTLLRSKKNPLRKPVYEGGTKSRSLAFSLINIGEKYLQRYTMTTFVAFIFRMLDEYDPEVSDTLISEDDPEFSKRVHQKIKEIQINKPVKFFTDEINRINDEKKKLEESITIDSDKQNEILGKITDLTKDKFIAYIRLIRHKIYYLHVDIDIIEESLRKIKKNELLTPEELKNKVNKLTDEKKKLKELVVEYKDQLNDIAKKSPVDVEEYKFKLYEPNDDDYDRATEQVKVEMNISSTKEEAMNGIQESIRTFLLKYLQFNPDEHVRCAYKPNYEDKTRTPLEKTKKKDKEDLRYEKLILPPSDTFHRWQRYMDNHYEELRQATDDIYAERSDLENALIPLEVFEGDDEEIKKGFDVWKRKYSAEFEAEVYLAKFANWNLISAWSENRDIIDFYSKQTEIIKRIIDQSQEDQKIGKNMLNKRVNIKKNENIKQHGEHDTGLDKYREGLGGQLEKYGAKPVSEILDETKQEITGETKDDEVEVNVHIIKPIFSKRNRKIRGQMEQWNFQMPTEAIPEKGVEVFNPSEFHKKLQENELTNSFQGSLSK